MDLMKIAKILKGESPLSILKEVVKYNIGGVEQNTFVKIRAFLSRDYILEGAPVVMSESHVVVISEEKRIVYLDANELSALEILNPEAILDVLTGGEYFTIPANGILSNLELKRIFKDAQSDFYKEYEIDLVSNFLDNKIATDKEKFQFKNFLKILVRVLEAIYSDPIGNEALSNIKELEIISSDTNFSITKSENKLICNISMTKNFPKNLEQQLITLIEQKL